MHNPVPLPAQAQESSVQELLVDATHADALRHEALALPSITLSARQLCDLELLMNGAFAPLRGFLDEADWDSVLERMRLADGRLWPVPIILDVAAAAAERIEVGARVALRDGEGFMLAVLEVTSRWHFDWEREAERVYGCTDPAHAGVAHVRSRAGSVCLGGPIEGLQLPTHYDYAELRYTPAELRHLYVKLGWRSIAGFHTSRPMHRVHREVSLHAAKRAQAHLLIHPVVGLSRPRDLDYFARVKCYQSVLAHYPHGLAQLALLPLAMRMAGPRSALWHALVRRNYGCSHFIVGPHHGSPPQSADEPFYPVYAARDALFEHAVEMGITALGVDQTRWSTTRARFVTETQSRPGEELLASPSDAEIAHRLSAGEELPEWLSFPAVLQALRQVHPPRSRQGITLFFTGLSGSGKSTLARIMFAKFVEEGRRPVTLLDGDIVRQHLSSELGFSKHDRDVNVRRIGFVASEITKNAGVAICAPIAPYAATRRAVREMVEARGAMIEVHVATPLEVCEGRDRKGLYAKARQGLIPEFTGISDPYEEPELPELRIDTSELSPMEAAQIIFLYLLREGYLDAEDAAA